MMPPIDDARYESIDNYKELRESLQENLRELQTQPNTFCMNLVNIQQILYCINLTSMKKVSKFLKFCIGTSILQFL